jgi:hypothetical protein
MHKLGLFAAAVTLTAAPALAQDVAGGPSRGAAPSPVSFTVTGTYSDGTSRVVEDVADADSDGDGRMDEGELRFTCGGGHARAVAFTRDAGSGMATGKRMHKPMPIVRSPVAAGSALKASWDLAKGKGARSAATGPIAVALDPGQPDLCS